MLSEKRASITGPQESYLKRLIDQCFSKHRWPKTGFNYLDRNHLDTLSMIEASRAINALKDCLTKAN